MYKLSIFISCYFLLLINKFSNGETMPYLSMEEYHRYRLLLKMEITKAFPSDGDDSSDMVVQEANDKLNVTYYKFGVASKPVFISVGMKNIGKDVVVLLRGDDYIDPLNKQKFVVLRKRGSGNEYNVHLAQIWRDFENKPHVVFEDAKISILPSVSKLIAYLNDGIFSNPSGKGSMRLRCSWFGFTLLCDNGEKLKLADIADLFAGSYGLDKGEEEGDGTSGSDGSNNDDDEGTMGSNGDSGTIIEDGSRKDIPVGVTGSGSAKASSSGGTGGSGGGKASSSGGTSGGGGGKGTSSGGTSGSGGGKGTSSGGTSGGGKGTSTGGAAGSGSAKASSSGGTSGSGSGKGTSAGGTSGSGGTSAGGTTGGGMGSSVGGTGGSGGAGNNDDGVSFDTLNSEVNGDGEYYVKIKGEGAPGPLARKSN